MVGGVVSVGVDALLGDPADALEVVAAAIGRADAGGVVRIEVSPPAGSSVVSLFQLEAWSALVADQLGAGGPVEVWWRVSSRSLVLCARRVG